MDRGLNVFQKKVRQRLPSALKLPINTPMTTDIKQVLERATARPWKLDESIESPESVREWARQNGIAEDNSTCVIGGIAEQGDGVRSYTSIAVINTNQWAHSADAELIVAAVNAFESNRELITVLKKALEAAALAQDSRLMDSPLTKRHESFADQKRREALAKVREAGL